MSEQPLSEETQVSEKEAEAERKAIRKGIDETEKPAEVEIPRDGKPRRPPKS